MLKEEYKRRITMSDIDGIAEYRVLHRVSLCKAFLFAKKIEILKFARIKITIKCLRY